MRATQSLSRWPWVFRARSSSMTGLRSASRAKLRTRVLSVSFVIGSSHFRDSAPPEDGTPAECDGREDCLPDRSEFHYQEASAEQDGKDGPRSEERRAARD